MLYVAQVVDINEEGNNETADLLREMGATVFAFQCDVSKKENIKRYALIDAQDRYILRP